jgi:hypothetical protein
MVESPRRTKGNPCAPRYAAQLLCVGRQLSFPQLPSVLLSTHVLGSSTAYSDAAFRVLFHARQSAPGGREMIGHKRIRPRGFVNVALDVRFHPAEGLSLAARLD